MIADNLDSVMGRIARSCKKAGRSTEDVELVCVTKEASLEDINEAIELGIKIIGENRVRDAAIKYAAIGNKAAMHLIGHLQTNKVKDAVNIFSLIHSIDSSRLAEVVNNEADKIDKVQDVLMQVNVSGETSKFGVETDKAKELCDSISKLENINLIGLMTIAPEVKDPEMVRPFFSRLRELRDELNAAFTGRPPIKILSMGMTNDFEVAIEEGANMIRIGRAIFGQRRIV